MYTYVVEVAVQRAGDVAFESAAAAFDAGLKIVKKDGEELLCCLLSTSAFQNHHQICGMDSERGFSLRAAVAVAGAAAAVDRVGVP